MLCHFPSRNVFLRLLRFARNDGFQVFARLSCGEPKQSQPHSGAFSHNDLKGRLVLSVVWLLLAGLVALSPANHVMAGSLAAQIEGEVQIAGDQANLSELQIDVYASLGDAFAVVAHLQPEASGRYSVNLPLRPDNQVFVSVKFQGVTYSTEPVQVLAEGSTMIAPITVYPTTDDDSVIRVESSTMVIANVDVSHQQMAILEMLTVVNDSNKVYIGDKRGEPGTGVPGVLNRTLTIELPTGAEQFKPLSGLDPEKLLPVGAGFVDTEPLMPGQRQVVYSYRIGYPFAVHQFVKPVTYQTDRLRVLIPDLGTEISSPDLQPVGTTELQGRRYQMLAGEDLSPGSKVSIQVADLPVRAPITPLDLPTLRIMTVVLLALVLGGVVFYATRIERSLASSQEEVIPVTDNEDQPADPTEPAGAGAGQAKSG